MYSCAQERVNEGRSGGYQSLRALLIFKDLLWMRKEVVCRVNSVLDVGDVKGALPNVFLRGFLSFR